MNKRKKGIKKLLLTLGVGIFAITVYFNMGTPSIAEENKIQVASSEMMHVHDGDEVNGGECYSPVICNGTISSYTYTGACGDRNYNQISWSTWLCFYGHQNIHTRCCHGQHGADDCPTCIAENWANAGWNYYPKGGCAVQIQRTGYKCGTCNTTYAATGTCPKILEYELNCPLSETDAFGTINLFANYSSWTSETVKLTPEYTINSNVLRDSVEWVWDITVNGITYALAYNENDTLSLTYTDAEGNHSYIPQFDEKFLTNAAGEYCLVREDGSLETQLNGNYTFSIPVTHVGISGNSVTYTMDYYDATKPSLSVDISDTEWTKNDVIITLSASDAYAGLMDNAYSYDNGATWTDNAVYTCTQNETLEIVVRDKAGNISTDTVIISNIDKDAPAVNSVMLNPPYPTNQDVKITLNAVDTGVGLHSLAYSYDNGITWTDENFFEIFKNGVYDFLIRDELGNTFSNRVGVSTIDKIAPSVSLSADTTEWTNGNVIITASAQENTPNESYSSFGFAAKPITWDGGNTWLSISEGKTLEVSANGTYSISVKDYVGNHSQKSITITNIDKDAPVIGSFEPTSLAWVRDFVTLSVSADDNLSGLADYPYSYDNGATWTDESTLTVEHNGDYTVIVKDKAGNTSQKVCTVANIDKDAPVISGALLNPSEWTNTDVLVSINATDAGSGVNTYAFDLMSEENKQAHTHDGDSTNGGACYDAIICNGNIKGTTTTKVCGASISYANNGYTWRMCRWCQGGEQGCITYPECPESESADGISHQIETYYGIYCPACEKGKESINLSDVSLTRCPFSTTTTTYNCESCDYSYASGGICSQILNYELSCAYSGKVTWTSDNFITVSENGTYKVYVKDLVGNIAESTYTVTNIDRDIPVITEIFADKTEWTNEDVLVSVIAQDALSGLHDNAYSYDNKLSWINMDNNAFSSNGTYIISVRDKAGNIIEESFIIANIDKVYPVASTSLSTHEWTTDNIIATITASDSDSGLTSEPYSYDNKLTWTSDNIIEYSENGEYIVYIEDVAGNVLEHTIAITNIDREAPEVIIEKSEVVDEKQTVTIIATDVGVGLNVLPYSFDNGLTWTNDNTVEYDCNGTYTVIVKDALGNQATHEYTVNALDSVPPVVSLYYSDSVTNGDIIITVNAYDEISGLAAMPYSYDDGITWTDKNSVIITENGEYVIKVSDAVGNIETKTVSISIIDKSSPTIDNVTYSTTSITADDIKVTFACSDIGAGLDDFAYSYDGGISWEKDNSYIAQANGTYTVWVRDKAGNVAIEKFDITNIKRGTVDISGITLNQTSWTNGSVTIMVTVSESSKMDLGATPYCFDGITYTSDNSYTVHSNGTYVIKIKDAYGNITTVNCTISNIDKTAPVIYTDVLRDSIEKNVSIVANASDYPSGIDAYSWDEGATWSLTNSIVVSEAGTYIVMARDKAGNVTFESVIITQEQLIFVDGTDTSQTTKPREEIVEEVVKEDVTVQDIELIGPEENNNYNVKVEVPVSEPVIEEEEIQKNYVDVILTPQQIKTAVGVSASSATVLSLLGFLFYRTVPLYAIDGKQRRFIKRVRIKKGTTCYKISMNNKMLNRINSDEYMVCFKGFSYRRKHGKELKIELPDDTLTKIINDEVIFSS